MQVSEEGLGGRFGRELVGPGRLRASAVRSATDNAPQPDNPQQRTQPEPVSDDSASRLEHAFPQR